MAESVNTEQCINCAGKGIVETAGHIGNCNQCHGKGTIQVTPFATLPKGIKEVKYVRNTNTTNNQIPAEPNPPNTFVDDTIALEVAANLSAQADNKVNESKSNANPLPSTNEIDNIIRDEGAEGVELVEPRNQEAALAAESNDNSNESDVLFSDFVIRSIYINAVLFLFCIFSFVLWFTDISEYPNDLRTAFILSQFSVMIIFIACIIGIILSIAIKYEIKIPFEQIVIYIVMSLYFIGAFFYFVAGCQYAQFYNKLGESLNIDITSFAAIWWTEMFYIAAVTFVTGLDLWKRYLNKRELRVIVYVGLFAFCSMILTFSYLVADSNVFGNSEFIVIGLSYLFGWITAMVFIVVFVLHSVLTEEYILKEKLDKMKPIIDMICSVLLAVFMFWTTMAYWIIKRESKEYSVYYGGLGIFILSNAVMITFDITFSDYFGFCKQK